MLSADTSLYETTKTNRSKSQVEPPQFFEEPYQLIELLARPHFGNLRTRNRALG